MSRLPPLDPADLNPDQRAVLEAIESGPRGARHGRRIGMVGPFGLWVRAPRIGKATQALGAAARFETSLPENVKEVAICTVGAFHRARFEFAAHGPMAIAAGVPAEAVEAIRTGADPVFEQSAETLAYQLTRQLLADHRIEDETYRQATETFGVEGTIELVTVVGYYCLVSLSLNAFEVPLREGMEDPFPG